MEKDVRTGVGGGEGSIRRKAMRLGTNRELRIKEVRASEGMVGHEINSSAKRC